VRHAAIRTLLTTLSVGEVFEIQLANLVIASRNFDHPAQRAEWISHHLAVLPMFLREPLTIEN
jgi:hypothetical protein